MTSILNSNITTGNPDKEPSPLAENVKLSYEIHQYSSFSTNYFPENILVDCPSDQTSRWSAHTNTPPQYLILKLKRPAIVKMIKFGKFEKAHVCNIKKFRIYGGLAQDRMVLILEGGLINDNIPEVFNLRCLTEGDSEHLPILYLKIVPLLSWGPTFNFSIWYIELIGQDDPTFTNTSLKNYNTLREVEIVKLCLKHFRQQGYATAFKALQEQTQVRLEHPLIENLHVSLVVNGDFEKAEQLIVRCVEEGYMDNYLNRQDYKHSWRTQATEKEERPGNRGGHQLVMDVKKRLIYLYGGWDGFQDLSDLWVFHIETNCWSLVHPSSEQINGPTPRSCHKMIFDPVSENIFMLGRYLDNSIRTTEYVKSDFFLYDTRTRTWLLICDDTSQVGGPQLVYDHQMCVDAEKRTIYVFGGKILTPRSVTSSSTNEPEYSGLFSYHIATNTWTQILVDCYHPSAAQAEVLSIKSRITHCMVFHNRNRKLYIYGGLRGKEDIDDFITFDVDTQVVEVLNKEFQSGSIVRKEQPSPGYTLRATLDCTRDEIYVFSSLSKLKDRRDTQQIEASNSFWVYSLAGNKWSRIYHYKHSTAGADLMNTTTMEPCPRYAHQLIYDDVAKVHYLFGGNPGKPNLPQFRLDDFWTLTLEKPKRVEVLRHCCFLVRKLHYEELSRFDPYAAMQYLRNHIAEVVDHSNAEQLKSFHKLASLLFKTEDHSSERLFKTQPLRAAQTDTAADISDTAGEAGNIELQTFNKPSPRFDTEMTNAADDLSMDSCESGSTPTTTSSTQISHMTNSSDRASYEQYRSIGGKRPLHDYLDELQNRRSFLFNQLVRLMPASMVQPESNLSDFVIM